MTPRKVPPVLCGCNMKGQYRAWRLIVWPDSAPENWLEILQAHCVPFAVSCLHTSDLDAVLEDERKPHYHLVFFFDGKKSFAQFDLYAQEVNAPIPLPCDSPRGAVRYFCHCDHPDKPQYAISSVRTFFGAEVRQYFELSFYQEVQDSKDLFQFIDDLHIVEFAHLIRILRHQGLDEWYILATKKMTIPIKAYIASIRHSEKMDSEEHD